MPGVWPSHRKRVGPLDPCEFSRTRAFLYRLCKPGGVDIQVGDVVYTLTSDNSHSPMERLEEHGGLLLWDLYDAGQYLTGEGSWERNGRPPFIPTERRSEGSRSGQTCPHPEIPRGGAASG